MTKLSKSVVENGERIVVEMTDLEQKEFETQRANDAANKVAEKASRQAVLDRLGITAEEAALLLA